MVLIATPSKEWFPASRSRLSSISNCLSVSGINPAQSVHSTIPRTHAAWCCRQCMSNLTNGEYRVLCILIAERCKALVRGQETLVWTDSGPSRPWSRGPGSTPHGVFEREHSLFRLPTRLTRHCHRCRRGLVEPEKGIWVEKGAWGKGMRRPPVIGPTNGLRLLSSNLSPWNNYVALSRLALSGAWVGAVCVPGWRRVADRVRVPLGGQPPALGASGSSEIGGRRYGPRPAPCARPVCWLLPCGRCCCTVAAVSETHSGEAAGAGAWLPGNRT